MGLVPFQRFRPDQSRFSSEASNLIQNCKPTKDGWAPIKTLTGLGTALPSEPRGGISVKADDGTWQIFAGTATNLYRYNSSTYAPVEISRATDDYDLLDGEYWTFFRFGNYVIATAEGSDYPQYVDLNTSNDFANLTNATFEARTGFVVGDFVVFCQIDGNRRKMKWSGVNNPFFWTKAQRGSDEQELPDGGDIQGGISQALNGLVMQESAIRRMVFDPGSGLAFRFEVLDPERGVLAPRSIVNVGPNQYAYLSKDGFYWGPEARPIGAERVDRWFFANCDSDYYGLVSGVADPFEKIVWWRFRDANGMHHLLGFDWQLDEWFYSNNNAVELLPAATVGYTLEDLDAFGSLETLPYSLDSRFWRGGIPGFAGFTSDYKFGFFDGPNQEATITTEHKALRWPRRAVTGRIRVLVDSDNATCAVAAKETQNGTLSFGSDLSRQTGQSFINSRVSGRWHQFKVKLPAGDTWSNAVGIDIEHTDGGER